MTAREMSKYLRNYLTAKGLTLSIAKSTIGLPNPQLDCQIHNWIAKSTTKSAFQPLVPRVLSPLKETIKETALRVKEKRSGSRTRFHPPSSFANAPSEVAGTREQAAAPPAPPAVGEDGEVTLAVEQKPKRAEDHLRSLYCDVTKTLSRENHVQAQGQTRSRPR